MMRRLVRNDSSMYSSILFGSPISSSIFMAIILAPPWATPLRLPSAAAMAE